MKLEAPPKASTPVATSPTPDKGPKTATSASKMDPIRRSRITRTIQYSVLVLIIIWASTKADWQALSSSFFDLEIIAGMMPEVFSVALVNTLVYTVLAFGAGLVLGLLLAMMRLSQVPAYRWLATGYVELFRGLPALVVLFMVGFGINTAFPTFQFPGGFYGQVTVALALTAAAYICETLRSGIQAVPKGQMEASRSLGMSSARTMVSVILPQAFRIVIPPLTNEIISLTKDSSLVYILGLSMAQYELTKFGQTMLVNTANPTPLVVVGLSYLIITIPLSQLVRHLERRYAKSR